MWGRIKLIRDAVAAGRMLDLSAVMALDNRKQMDDESYAWCWAATKFLDSHPRYRDRFRGLKQHVTDQDFNEVVQRLYGKDWQAIEAEWPAYIAALDYGYDFERMAIDFRRGHAAGWQAAQCDDCGRSGLAVVRCLARGGEDVPRGGEWPVSDRGGEERATARRRGRVSRAA